MALLIPNISDGPVALIGGLTREARANSSRFLNRKESPTLGLLDRSVRTYANVIYPSHPLDQDKRNAFVAQRYAIQYRFFNSLGNQTQVRGKDVNRAEVLNDCAGHVDKFLHDLNGKKEVRFHIPKEGDSNFALDITASDLVYTIVDLKLFNSASYSKLGAQEALKRKDSNTLNNLEEEILKDPNVLDLLVTSLNDPNNEFLQIVLEQAMVLEYALEKIELLKAQQQPVPLA